MTTDVRVPVVTTEVVEVNAEMATEWLNANKGNRPLGYQAVMRLVHDMTSGRWHLSTDAIGFDVRGRLINGQHRLAALVEAAQMYPDISIPLLVTRGLPEESFTVIDQGKVRPSGQVLQTQGFSHYVVAAVVARRVLYYDSYPDTVWRGSEAISKIEVVQFALEHREEIYAARPWSPGRYFPLNVSSYATLHYLVNRVSEHEDRWDEFEAGIVKGENLAPTDPRLILRNWKPTSKWGLNGAQPQLASYIKAWNAFVEGRPVALLSFKRSELPMPAVR